MKIVFLFDSTYPYYTGGIETWIYNVCERLINFCDITIFTVENYRKDNTMGKHTGIDKRIKFVPVKNLNHVRVLRPFIRSYIAVYNCNITVYSMLKAARKYLKKEEEYYVIALGTVFAGKTARLIKKEFPNVKTIVSSRSLHPEVLEESYPGVGRFAFKMERTNLENADAIWSNGEDTQQALAKKGFHSQIIRNGVDFSKLDCMEPYDFNEIGLGKEFVIVTIGTVQKIKGYYEAIQALKILKEKYQCKVHLVGIGKGNLDKFNEYAKMNGVEGQVHLLGEQQDVVRYAKAANAIVCLSGGSGYGMAALESMVSKTPIIAWDSPVYQQLLKDRESGILVKSWDSSALAEGIYDVYEHREEYRFLGENAFNFVKKFDWGNVIDDILGALKDIK